MILDILCILIGCALTLTVVCMILAACNGLRRCREVDPGHLQHYLDRRMEIEHKDSKRIQ